MRETVLVISCGLLVAATMSAVLLGCLRSMRRSEPFYTYPFSATPYERTSTVPRLRKESESKENAEMTENVVMEQRWSPSCGYVADVGYICPITYEEKNIRVRPYQDCSPEIQSEVARHLREEWGDINEVYDDADSDKFVRRRWPGTDVLYVMTDRREFVGCVGVDRRNFFPFISHVYVKPDKRNLGYGRKLVRIAERYSKEHGFTQSKLWCEEKLLPFYEKQGYTVEDKTERDGTVQHIMSKELYPV